LQIYRQKISGYITINRTKNEGLIEQQIGFFREIFKSYLKTFIDKQLKGLRPFIGGKSLRDSIDQ